MDQFIRYNTTPLESVSLAEQEKKNLAKVKDKKYDKDSFRGKKVKQGGREHSSHIEKLLKEVKLGELNEREREGELWLCGYQSRKQMYFVKELTI